MRRIISPILIGLGTFLIVAGVLIKAYAIPTLAVVPMNYDSTTYLEAKDATDLQLRPRRARAGDGRPGDQLAHGRG